MFTSVLSAVLISLSLSSHAVLGWLFNNKVCYEELGCFRNNDPFNNTFGELPDSPDNIKVRCYLWTRGNPSSPQELMYQNVSTIAVSNFAENRPTKILIHGFMSSKDASPVVANLSQAFIKQGDYNVIGIDWADGAKQLYPKAVANTRVVGAVLAKLVTVLIEKFNMKLRDLHIVGHSLGAHTAGYIGRRNPGIARITGLDPAGPLFSQTDPIVRLDPKDATFVDVIHSDAAPLEDAGFGTIQPLGHMDFFPNGGQFQPGCPPPIKTTVEQLLLGRFESAFDSVSCGHDRAIWYFIESVLNPGSCQFTSHPCANWTQFQQDHCNTCGHSPCPVMGLNSINSNSRGSFYLQTNSQSPFCRS